MDLSPELATALTGLGLSAIAALGVLIRYIVDRLETKINDNTKLTQEVKDTANEAKAAAENGHAVREALIRERDEVIAALAKVRDEAQRFQLERDAYRDMVRFTNARPNGRAILLDYAERRQTRTYDEQLDALIAPVVTTPPAPPRAAEGYIDDPTGTDAGRRGP